MIFIFFVLQVLLIQTGWWVYNVYFMRSRHDHPPIFWNPVFRNLLIYVPTFGILGLIIAAFFVTSHPWIFLLFSLIFWIYNGHKRENAFNGAIIPVFGGGESALDALSAEEVLEDLQFHKQDVLNRPESRIEKDINVEGDNAPVPKKEWIIEQVQLEDIEKGIIPKQSQAIIPMHPSKNEEWQHFKRSILQDDELWTFSSGISKIKSPYHWFGICLIRQGEIVHYISEQMHVSYKR